MTGDDPALVRRLGKAEGRRELLIAAACYATFIGYVVAVTASVIVGFSLFAGVAALLLFSERYRPPPR